jgi:ribose 5-phosphate isomerase B
MRIAIGADHAGFALKQHLIATLQRLGHTADDRGTHSDAIVDYPPICADVARQVVDGEHNDANVLAIGARIVASTLADEIVTLWLTTAFAGGRHQRRIDQIAEIERSERAGAS